MMLADSIAIRPRDPRLRIAIGLAYAGLNLRDDAVREAQHAMDLVPISEHSPGATASMGGAVEIFTRLGEVDEALDLIELMLALPAGREMSVPFLRVDPTFDPLRNSPRFQALLNRFSTQ